MAIKKVPGNKDKTVNKSKIQPMSADPNTRSSAKAKKSQELYESAKRHGYVRPFNLTTKYFKPVVVESISPQKVVKVMKAITGRLPKNKKLNAWEAGEIVRPFRIGFELVIKPNFKTTQSNMADVAESYNALFEGDAAKGHVQGLTKKTRRYGGVAVNRLPTIPGESIKHVPCFSKFSLKDQARYKSRFQEIYRCVKGFHVAHAQRFVSSLGRSSYTRGVVETRDVIPTCPLQYNVTCELVPVWSTKHTKAEARNAKKRWKRLSSAERSEMLLDKKERDTALRKCTNNLARLAVKAEAAAAAEAMYAAMPVAARKRAKALAVEEAKAAKAAHLAEIAKRRRDRHKRKAAERAAKAKAKAGAKPKRK